MNRQIIWGLSVCLSVSVTVQGSHDREQKTVSSVRSIRLDGNTGGKRFDGIELINGGGATSVLLKDYPEPQLVRYLTWCISPSSAHQSVHCSWRFRVMATLRKAPYRAISTLVGT